MRHLVRVGRVVTIRFSLGLCLEIAWTKRQKLDEAATEEAHGARHRERQIAGKDPDGVSGDHTTGNHRVTRYCLQMLG